MAISISDVLVEYFASVLSFLQMVLVHVWLQLRTRQLLYENFSHATVCQCQL